MKTIGRYQPGSDRRCFAQSRWYGIALAAILMSTGLVSCYESNSEEDAPPAFGITGDDNLPVGNALSGRTFYNQNCSVCHAAGADDTTRAFGAIDLANQGSRISGDMSHFDETYNLMARFTDLDQARVDDLKRYLSGL